MRKESNVAYIFVLGIILGAALLYFPPYAWAWVGDDYVQFDYVLEFVKRPLSAIQLLNPYFLPWYYRPLQNFWFLGNRLVFGLTPAPFYWQMILWHSLATALVYRVLRQFGERPFSALLATALFAIHGHYVDVVGWNSSMAILVALIFSLASLSAYLEFLTAPLSISPQGEEKPVPLLSGGVRGGKNKHLALSFLFFVLALLTHEEAILLPLFLIVLTMVKGRKQKIKRKWWQTESRMEWFVNLFTLPQKVMFIGMLVLTGTLIIIQFTRPNLTIDISQTPAAQWLELVSPTHIGQFVKDISLRYTITANWSLTQSTTPLLLATVILLLLGAWFLLGSWTVRLGLIWAALHLGLIYATLWQSKPNLLAGRHFYQASFGLALAIGASIDQLRQLKTPQVRVGRRRLSLMMIGIVSVVTAILISHVLNVQTTQQKWLNRAETDQAAQEQMKILLPEIGESTRVFANRFPISPSFFRAVTEIWYELDEPIPRPSGSFMQLEEHGQATSDFYVFDYLNDKLYNLMPELQAHDETIFIWNRKPRLDIVADDGEYLKIRTDKGKYDYAVVDSGEGQRFAVSLAPTEVVNGWLSLTYVLPNLPPDSILHLSVRTDAESGAPVRVRLDPVLDDPFSIFDERVMNDWVKIEAPMNEFAGRTMVVRLETAVPPGGTVYWGNPRLVSGPHLEQTEDSFEIFWAAPHGCNVDSLSPNDKWMVTDCDGTTEFAKGTWIFSLTGIEEPRQISEEPIPYRFWAPDGSMFVTREIDAPVSLYFVEDPKKPGVIYPNPSRLYGYPIWAPNSKSFIIRNWTATNAPSLSQFQLDGSVKTIIEGWEDFHLPPLYPGDPVWTSDTQQIIYSGTSDPKHKYGQIWTLNPNSGEQELLIETDETLYHPILSPNDNLIALHSSGGHPWIYIFDIENQTLQQIPQEFLNANSYTWSPNSKHLFIQDIDNLWILTLEDFTLQEIPKDSYIWWSVWSPDSKYLAARDDNGIWILSLEDFSREILFNSPQTDEKTLIKYLYGWTEDGKALLVSFPEENALKIVPIQSD